MDRNEFETIPFSYAESEGEFWETERGRFPASPRSRPATPRGRPPPPRPGRRPPPRPKPPFGATAPLRGAAAPCICPAHGTEFVRWVQSSLNLVARAGLAVDGVMSTATRAALRRFQTQRGLPVDGIAGPEVEQALRDARRGTGAGTEPDAGAGAATDPAAPESGEVFEFETLEFESSPSMPTLRRGSRGTAVSDLQRRLGAAGVSPGAVDGIFGSRTDAAVRAFQRARGLAADGIVGPLTWGALLNSPTRAPTPAPAPVRAGADPAIEALNLAEPARSAAYTVKARHPWVAFTSGRRDVAGQASAMAGNVVLNRQWIEQTYADNAVSRAAQAWVDGHPEARSKEAITAGLLGVLQGFSSADLGRLSYHLSGLAFDIQPVSGQLASLSATVNALPRLKEFLTMEGGLERWHVALM